MKILILFLLTLVPLVVTAQTKAVKNFGVTGGVLSYTLADGSTGSVTGTSSGTATTVTGSVPKRINLTGVPSGTNVVHGLNSTTLVILFKRTGTNYYDFSYTWSVVNTNTIALVTPYTYTGVREVFTGELTIFISTN